MVRGQDSILDHLQPSKLLDMHTQISRATLVLSTVQDTSQTAEICQTVVGLESPVGLESVHQLHLFNN